MIDLQTYQVRTTLVLKLQCVRLSYCLENLLHTVFMGQSLPTPSPEIPTQQVWVRDPIIRISNKSSGDVAADAVGTIL